MIGVLFVSRGATKFGLLCWSFSSPKAFTISCLNAKQTARKGGSLAPMLRPRQLKLISKVFLTWWPRLASRCALCSRSSAHDWSAVGRCTTSRDTSVASASLLACSFARERITLAREIWLIFLYAKYKHTGGNTKRITATVAAFCDRLPNLAKRFLLFSSPCYSLVIQSRENCLSVSTCDRSAVKRNESSD